MLSICTAGEEKKPVNVIAGKEKKNDIYRLEISLDTTLVR